MLMTGNKQQQLCHFARSESMTGGKFHLRDKPEFCFRPVFTYMNMRRLLRLALIRIKEKCVSSQTKYNGHRV